MSNQTSNSKLSYILEMLSSIPRTAWTHKYKTILALIVFYLGRKVWNLYTVWIRPFLSIAKTMKGDGAPQQKEKEKEQEDDEFVDVDMSEEEEVDMDE